MSDHPTTFRGESHAHAFDWDDRAAIHPAGDGRGLFDAMNALHRGTMAEMVALMVNMPAEQRRSYVIQKAGDRQFGPDEVLALYERSDYPGQAAVR